MTPRLTVAIASYQRREPLRRLLAGLAEELGGNPWLRAAVDVVVVCDGSTDGSQAMVEALDFPVPLRALWQPNRGLAAARNAGLAAARGELVLFLDDDLLPGPDLLQRHLAAHAPRAPVHVRVGPCLLNDGAVTLDETRRFWENRYAGLSRSGLVERFDRFSAANTSAPVATLRGMGGFHEGFVGYGMEDYELGWRLLAAGVPIRFDPLAVAWHEQHRTFAMLCANRISEGANRVRLVRLHPGSFDAVFPGGPVGRSYRLVGWLRPRSTATYRLVGRWALRAAGVAERRAGASRPMASMRSALASLAKAAHTAVGVASLDTAGDCLARLLGLSPPSQRGAAAKRLTAAARRVPHAGRRESPTEAP